MTGEEVEHAPGTDQEQELPDHQTWQMAQEVLQMVYESVEPVAEQVVHVTKILPQMCIPHCAAKQFVDVTVPSTAEKVVQDPVHHQAQEVAKTVYEPVEQIGKLAVDATSLIGNSIESNKLHTDDIPTEELQDCGPRNCKRHQCSVDGEQLLSMKRLGSVWPGRPPGHMMNDDTEQEDGNSWPGRPPGTC